MRTRNEHTEHCCINHGCKYGKEDCPVVTGKLSQSCSCELCEIPVVFHVETVNKAKGEVAQFTAEGFDTFEKAESHIRAICNSFLGEKCDTITGDGDGTLLQMKNDCIELRVKVCVPRTYNVLDNLERNRGTIDLYGDELIKDFHFELETPLAPVKKSEISWTEEK